MHQLVHILNGHLSLYYVPGPVPYKHKKTDSLSSKSSKSSWEENHNQDDKGCSRAMWKWRRPRAECGGEGKDGPMRVSWRKFYLERKVG